MLVISAPEAVSRDRLADGLWGERPRASTAHAVHVYVSGIRRLFRGAGEEAVQLRGFAAGYALETDLEPIDAKRVERMIGDGQAALSENQSRACSSMRWACGADHRWLIFASSTPPRAKSIGWRSFTSRRRSGLSSPKLALREHDQVIGRTTRLLEANLLRAGRRRLLMLALRRSAEALAAYREAVTALDEIGLEPSIELRQLEQGILRYDEFLRAGNGPAAALGRGSEPGREAGTEYGINAGRLPSSGEVALLFTDIDGSTRLLDRLGELCTGVLTEHHRVMREAVEAAGGCEVGTAGESCFVAFETVTASMRSPAAHGHRHERDRQVRTSAGARPSYGCRQWAGCRTTSTAVTLLLTRWVARPQSSRAWADAPPSICGLHERAGRPKGSRPANTIRHMDRTYASSSSWSDLKSVSRL
jgi:DNA-binding SARP family transcriptional activator